MTRCQPIYWIDCSAFPEKTAMGATPEIDRIVHVGTTLTKLCPLCSRQRIGGDRFEEGVNHLLTDHGCVILHAGQETVTEANKPRQATIVVVGLPRDRGRVSS